MPNEDNGGLRHLFSRIKGLFQRSSDDPTPLVSPTASDIASLLRFAQEAPLVYGFWGNLKRLYKQAEAVQNVDILATLISRLDTVPFPHLPKPAPNALDQLNILSINQMLIAENVLFLATTDMQRRHVLYAIDVTNPTAPNPILNMPFPYSVTLALEGEILAVVEQKSYRSAGGVHLFDIADLLHSRGNRQLRKLGTLKYPYANRVAIQGTFAVVLAYLFPNATLHFVDFSQPSAPRELSKMPFQGASHVVLAGRRACVLTKKSHSVPQSGLSIVDCSDPARPQTVQFLEIPSPATIQIAGNYAYVVSLLQSDPGQHGTAGIYCIDLGGPEPARQVGFFPLPYALDLAVRESYVYVARVLDETQRHNSGGVTILDFSNPAQPVRVGEYAGVEAQSVDVTGNTAFLLTRRSGMPQAISAVDISTPARPVRIGMPPTRKTLAYMKRRARRALRQLALRDPDAYLQLACAILTRSGQGRESVDLTTQWISMDLLYGASTRFVQHSHGRGAYALRHPRITLKTREESHPELWDRAAEQVALLYANPDLPWQTHEMALKILRSQKAPLPTLAELSLARYLNSPSVLLFITAAQQATATLEQGKPIAADLAATLFFRGTARHRQRVQAFLDLPEASRNWGVGDFHRAAQSWSAAFAARLFALASAPTKQPSLTRKQQAAFLLLFQRFSAIARREANPQLTAQLYATGRIEFTAWAFNVYRNLPAFQIERWLAALEPLEDPLRGAAVAAIRETVTQKQFDPQTARALAENDSAWVRAVGWTLLAHSATDIKVLTALWQDLLNAPEETAALRSALGSPDALTIFQRVNIEVARLLDHLRTRPWLAPLLPLEVLEKILRTVPMAATLELLRQPADLQWFSLKPALLGMLENTARRDAFWNAAFDRIGETGDETLIQRLLQDPDMIASFLEVEEIESFLKSANPTFGALLGEWVRAHPERFTRDTAELLLAATHMLPEIRDFGLQQARTLGFGVAFALRLVESELPPAVDLGKEFFDAENLVPAERQDRLIALCDSPSRPTRSYALTLVERYWQTLQAEPLLAHLTENPDPGVQAYVAGKLLQQLPETIPTTAAFDRSVLRRRERGRRAKELVKTRLEQTPAEDIGLLLELAQSRTPRDAEWALSQLAKLALQGVEIPGFTLEGVAGG